jgi:glycopeptide antibiotics resistance protein
LGWASLQTYLRPNETSLNVVLFVPLGLALGLLPGRRTANLLILAGLVSPFFVEAIQLVVQPLGRGCQTADIIDNLTGVVIGLLIGRSIGFVRARWVARTQHPPPVG